MAVEARCVLVRRRDGGARLVLVGLGGVGALAAPGGCDAETTYHCAVVRRRPRARPAAAPCVLDNLRHSYVDLERPHRTWSSPTSRRSPRWPTALSPTGEPLDAYHLGGGGLTLPRYLARGAARHPQRGLRDRPGVVDVDRERLGLETGPDLEVRVEDGRLGAAADSPTPARTWSSATPSAGSACRGT